MVLYLWRDESVSVFRGILMARPASGLLATVVTTAAVVLLLSGCVPDNGSPSSTSAATSSATPSAVPTETMPPPTKFPEVPGNEEPAPTEIEPVIVVAGIDLGGESVSASGYVAGIAEEGGTCTFAFTSGSSTVTRTTTSVSDQRSTSCGLVEVPISEFSSGSWSVTLRYSSPAAGDTSSQPTTVEIL